MTKNSIITGPGGTDANHILFGVGLVDWIAKDKINPKGGRINLFTIQNMRPCILLSWARFEIVGSSFQRRHADYAVTQMLFTNQINLKYKSKNKSQVIT